MLFTLRMCEGSKLKPSFLYACFNEKEQSMECYMEFSEAMKETQLATQLEDLGFSRAVVFSYQQDDPRIFAVFERIMDKVHSQSYGVYKQYEGDGDCDLFVAVERENGPKKKKELSETSVQPRFQSFFFGARRIVLS